MTVLSPVGFGTIKPLSFSALMGVRQEGLSDWTTRLPGLTYHAWIGFLQTLI